MFFSCKVGAVRRGCLDRRHRHRPNMLLSLVICLALSGYNHAEVAVSQPLATVVRAAPVPFGSQLPPVSPVRVAQVATVGQGPAIAHYATVAQAPAFAQVAAVAPGPAVAHYDTVAQVPATAQFAPVSPPVQFETVAHAPATAQYTTVAQVPAIAQFATVNEAPATVQFATVAQAPTVTQSAAIAPEPAVQFATVAQVPTVTKLAAVAPVQAVPLQQCVDESEVLQSFYHAPARAVPFPRVDPVIKRGFLELFHRDFHQSHMHNSPHDDSTAETCDAQAVIDPAILAIINELCPRNAFFYSFAPRHVNATTTLQMQLMNLTTPAEVLRVARALLHTHLVNPRVWYYALHGTILMRPDLNGYYLAWALDATPDLYLTRSVLEIATQGSSRPQPVVTPIECTTSAGIRVTDLRLEFANISSPSQQPDPQFQNRFQNGCANTANPSNPVDDTLPSFNTKPNTNNINNNIKPEHDFGGGGYGGYGYSNDRVVYYDGFNLNPPSPLQQPQQPNQISTTTARPTSFTTTTTSPPRPPPPPRRMQDSCVLYNGTLGANGEENRLWYFREDIMVNSHHWYWHQYFPLSSARHADRRGEQFYFTHHNLIARYNAERISNGLPPVIPLDPRLGASIGSGYNADILDYTSRRFWTPRAVNTPLSDILHMQDRDFQLDVAMAEITGLYTTLTSHISQGILLANRSNSVFNIDIRNVEGLSHLGNTIEAAEELSTHAQFYHTFGVHNLGHVAIGLSTDPDFRCQLPTGVMADLTVTMRDPAFYRIHSLVDEMFHQYKDTLGPYQIRDGEWPLQWDGVKVKDIEVISANGLKINYLKTFWSLRRFPLEEGIDGSIHDGDVETDICAQHLNHEPFTFRLTVDVNSCTRTASNRGTARIFIAPRYNVDGRRFTMAETRKLMIQLDAFPVELRRGRNTITRRSADSSSTRPWSRTLQDMLRDPDNGGQTEHCGCGWPEHLYIPKGSPEGTEFDLFAMITSFDQDQLLDTPADLNIQEPCNMPYLMCGIPYRRYPDSRPMGYPFDRPPYLVSDGGQNVRQVADLEEFTAHVSNMQSSVVLIQHLDTLVA